MYQNGSREMPHRSTPTGGCDVKKPVRSARSHLGMLFSAVVLPVALAACGGGGAGAGDAKAGEMIVQQNVCGSCHQSSNPADVLSGGDAPAVGSKIYAVN